MAPGVGSQAGAAKAFGGLWTEYYTAGAWGGDVAFSWDGGGGGTPPRQPPGRPRYL